MGELLIFAVLVGALGAGAWIVEGPLGRWIASRRAECISDAQTTSEKGLW